MVRDHRPSLHSTATATKGQIQQCRVPKRANTTFNVSSVLHGRWYIPVGLNPVIDCYPCQYGDWTLGETGVST